MRGSGAARDQTGRRWRRLLAGRRRGVADEALEHGQIIEEAAASGLGQPAGGVWAIALIALGDLDEASLLEHLQMARQIGVGEPAQLLEVGEGKALRMRHQRGQQAEPGLLVDDAIEALVGKRRAAVSLRHRSLRSQNTGCPPSSLGRSRTAGPWSMATARDWRCPAAAPRSRPGS